MTQLGGQRSERALANAAVRSRASAQIGASWASPDAVEGRRDGQVVSGPGVNQRDRPHSPDGACPRAELSETAHTKACDVSYCPRPE